MRSEDELRTTAIELRIEEQLYYVAHQFGVQACIKFVNQEDRSPVQRIECMPRGSEPHNSAGTLLFD